jgi:hypothetical protein
MRRGRPRFIGWHGFVERIMQALMIREDVSPAELRWLAKTEDDPRVAQQSLAIAAALEGMSREAAARTATDHPETERIALWFRDEARVGQKGRMVRRRFQHGMRPRMAKDQRYRSACVFGAVCPTRATGAALVLTRVSVAAMIPLFEEVASQLPPGAHAAMPIDNAGCHTAHDLPGAAQHDPRPSATCSCFELLAKVRIHPVQYALLGASVVLFPLLLLALGEATGFATAHALTALAVLVQASAYVGSVTRRGWLGAAMAALFGFLYVVLSLEAWSLLVGTLAVFVALSVVIAVTRRVEWGN